MTRLTDEQIDEVWYATPNLRGFVDAIAALAVQEVERERVGVNWEANFLSERHFRKDAEAKVATLTAQLAEVTKERDAHREQSRINDEVALCYRRDWQQAKAQLATAKREGWYEVAQYIQGQSHHPHPTDFGVATSIRAEAENRYPYPATPSGELCDADCGCPSPEAREVPFPARFLVLDHDGKCIGYVPMGCTEARQVVAMAQEARDAE